MNISETTEISQSTPSWCSFMVAAPASRASRRSGQTGTASIEVVCKPDWDKHGCAAPFRRNDELLPPDAEGLLIAFDGNGITGNFVDKARRMGIPVMEG